MNLQELRKRRQITTAEIWNKYIYEIGDENTLFVIYYGLNKIENCIIDNTEKIDYKKFHGEEFGGYIEQWKNGKFALILDRYYYESDNLEELEERLHQYNIEEDYYKETI